MRLFIGILLDNVTKQKIQAVQEHFKEFGSGNFTQKDNLHLTLVFLGEVSENQLTMLQRRMNEVTEESFYISLDHIGRFQRDGGDIWWIGLQKNPILEELQYMLSSNLKLDGFQLEDKCFTPHITLVRKFKESRQIDINHLMESKFKMKVTSICLMRSQSIDGRLTYTQIYKKELG